MPGLDVADSVSRLEISHALIALPATRTSNVLHSRPRGWSVLVHAATTACDKIFGSGILAIIRRCYGQWRQIRHDGAANIVFVRAISNATRRPRPICAQLHDLTEEISGHELAVGGHWLAASAA